MIFAFFILAAMALMFFAGYVCRSLKADKSPIKEIPNPAPHTSSDEYYYLVKDVGGNMLFTEEALAEAHTRARKLGV